MDVEFHVKVPVRYDIYVINVFSVCKGPKQQGEQTNFTNPAQSVVNQLSHLKQALGMELYSRFKTKGYDL